MVNEMKDFLGKKLSKGDFVVFMEISYRHLRVAKITKFGKKLCTLCTQHGRRTFQTPDQLIKLDDIYAKDPINGFPNIPLASKTVLKDFNGIVLQNGDKVVYPTAYVDGLATKSKFVEGIVEQNDPYLQLIRVLHTNRCTSVLVQEKYVFKTDRFGQDPIEGDPVVFIDPETDNILNGVLYHYNYLGQWFVAFDDPTYGKCYRTITRDQLVVI